MVSPTDNFAIPGLRTTPSATCHAANSKQIGLHGGYLKKEAEITKQKGLRALGS
jgi:hypothetical protein